ncbi:uncharacterized protein PAC_12300 [Phialocephala subalpina]|uniref:C2H2-type domain-containing protein n=1 Tax=Phialocephala subalpina TaxID=576137 RepID=A0A1L7XBK4_9HELO|nr:uncharacterized protein PAC_12300 [Phialocephala subalpina]
MTGPYWSSASSLELENALEGLQSPIYPPPFSDEWFRLSLDSEILVSSPSSFPEPDSWILKHVLLDFQAESPPGSRAQPNDDILTLETRASPTQHAVQPLDHKLHCSYHGCTSRPFQTLCDFKSHLRDHSIEVLRRWEETQPCRCPWSGNCKSKAVFKSRRILQTHLENVHITPLVCTVSGCSYRKPFRSNYDLKRHTLTAHAHVQSGEDSSQGLTCPYPKCDRAPKIFVRKDKWLNHIRTCHEGADCPLNHCKAGRRDGFLTQDDVVKHIRRDHGKFECAIGSCASQSPSRFAEFELLKHLELHHGLPYGDIDSARSAAKMATGRTVTPQHISSSWLDCKHCEENRLKLEADSAHSTPKSSDVDRVRQHTLSTESSWSVSE